MKKSNIYLGFIGVILVSLVIFFSTKSKDIPTPVASTDGTDVTKSDSPATQVPATPAGVPTTKSPIATLPVIPANYKTYTNDKYDFSLGYPKNLSLAYAYSSFHRMSNEWRTGAPSNIQGVSLFQVDIYKVDNNKPQGNPYPLFYSAVVRGSVSADAKNCYSTDGGNSQLVGTQIIGTVPFKVFTYNDAAMMQYIKSKNYRTVRNNMCYVLEQLATGSNYRDNTMTVGMTDAQLTAIFDSGFDVIKTFRFK